MKISFLDFWYDFIDDRNFLFYSIRELVSNLELVGPEKADVIIYSCFGNEHKKYNHCKKIFYTGENIRPNFNQCDYSLSFDIDSYNSRNIRLPLWYFYIDWFGVSTYKNPEYLIPVNYLYGENEFNTKKKNKFCCTVFSRKENIRMNFLSKLSTYKSVDAFGKIHLKQIPDGEKIKMDLISEYKFAMCFENSIYPGYFTEKLLHAKVSGCIPIYYSDKSFSVDFNINSCINLINYNNMDDMIEDIKKIDNDNILYKKINDEPIFQTNIDLSKILNKIETIIKK